MREFRASPNGDEGEGRWNGSDEGRGGLSRREEDNLGRGGKASGLPEEKGDVDAGKERGKRGSLGGGSRVAESHRTARRGKRNSPWSSLLRAWARPDKEDESSGRVLPERVGEILS